MFGVTGFDENLIQSALRDRHICRLIWLEFKKLSSAFSPLGRTHSPNAV